MYARRGIGDFCTDTPSWNPFEWIGAMLVCPVEGAYNGVSTAISKSSLIYDPDPPLPSPQSPSTTLVPNGGTDILGNPTYDVVEETPQANMDRVRAQLVDHFTEVDATNKAKMTSGSPWLWVAGAVVGVAVLQRMLGR